MVETLNFEFPAGSHHIVRRSNVGVVASGNLEVLIEAAEESHSVVRVRTSAAGFSDTWQAVFSKFFERHDMALSIEINDFGASPPVVLLRLEQALEEAMDGSGDKTAG
jgi:malonate decarboxylase delta subunit